MNFIVSLAHFCEIHGPASILCTQVLPPACVTCFPSSTSSSVVPTTAVSNASNTAFVPTPPQSSHGSHNLILNRAGVTSNPVSSATSTTRPHTAQPGAGTPVSSAASSSLSSPAETPPPSPRSPALTSSSLPTSAPGMGIGIHGGGHMGGPGGGMGMATSSSTVDSCKSCSMSLPKGINGGAPSIGADSPTSPRPAAGKTGNPVLRTKEAVVACTPPNTDVLDVLEEDDSPLPRRQRTNFDQLSTSPMSQPYYTTASSDDDTASPNLPSTPKIGTHTHFLTYLSTRAPSLPSRFSTLRQSCVRTLSCELIPAQTGPIMFGDPLAGYTIAYVFRLSDPRARGGRRSYALLCICPEQKIVINSWKYVVSTFESLVHRIKSLAAKKAADDAQASPQQLSNSISSITSRGPEGFLRRRAPGEGGFGGNQKGLADLVGREELFVEIHMCFVKLLGGLGRRYGYWIGNNELGHGGLGMGGVGASTLGSPIGGRSRAGSISSYIGGDERRTVAAADVSERPSSRVPSSNSQPQPQPQPRSTTTNTPKGSAAAAATAGLSTSETITKDIASTTTPTNTPTTPTITATTAPSNTPRSTALGKREEDISRNRPREVAVGY